MSWFHNSRSSSPPSFTGACLPLFRDAILFVFEVLDLAMNAGRLHPLSHACPLVSPLANQIIDITLEYEKDLTRQIMEFKLMRSIFVD
jgi:hypothetical protein